MVLLLKKKRRRIIQKSKMIQIKNWASMGNLKLEHERSSSFTFNPLGSAVNSDLFDIKCTIYPIGNTENLKLYFATVRTHNCSWLNNLTKILMAASMEEEKGIELLKRLLGEFWVNKNVDVVTAEMTEEEQDQTQLLLAEKQKERQQKKQLKRSGQNLLRKTQVVLEDEDHVKQQKLQELQKKLEIKRRRKEGKKATELGEEEELIRRQSHYSHFLDEKSPKSVMVEKDAEEGEEEGELMVDDSHESASNAKHVRGVTDEDDRMNVSGDDDDDDEEDDEGF